MAATAALRSAATTVKDTRSANLSLTLAGADTLWHGLTGEERYAAIFEARVIATAGTDRKVNRREDFIKFMARLFPGQPALPAMKQAVVVYTSDWVIDRGNKSRGLTNMVSELRTSMSVFGEWGLDEDDEHELRANTAYLRRAFPSSSLPQATLTLRELGRFYAYCAALDTFETRLAAALMRTMVATQARATELCNGALQIGDLVFDGYGLLINSVLNKTRKDTLDPLARVAPRLPLHLAAHDPYDSLAAYMLEVQSAATSHSSPVFRDFTSSPGGAITHSPNPLSADKARALLVRLLEASGVREASKTFAFNMHFGRAAGFNMYHNTLFLTRSLCAVMGGWRDSDVINTHYHKLSPLELDTSVRFELAIRASNPMFNWALP